MTYTIDCQCGKCLLASLKTVYDSTLNPEERAVIREELEALADVVREEDNG